MHASIFLLSLLSLIAGPIIYSSVKKTEGVHIFFEELNFVLITGFILLHILPEILNNAGYSALGFIFLGFLAPKLIDLVLKKNEGNTKIRFSVLLVGIFSLWIHTIIDGSLLGEPHHDHGSETILSLSILLHRFPVGLTIWFLFRPKFGFKVAAIVLLIMEGGTIIGFFLHESLYANVSQENLLLFHAFVTGSLIHMIIDLSEAEFHFKKEQFATNKNVYRGLGSIIGILGLFAIAVHPQLDLHNEHNVLNDEFFRSFISLALESAPVLILSYIISGILHVYLPISVLQWMNKGSRLNQAARGVALGIPFPVCSCGVIPIYRSLVKKGIPAAAGISFLIATPEIGVDSILLSLSLLGPKFTFLRLFCAFFVALIVGWLIGRIVNENKEAREDQEEERIEDKKPLSLQSFLSTFRYGIYEVFDHTAPWIIIGLAIAAIGEPLIETQKLLSFGPYAEVFLLGLLGLPIYVCASGATPFVAVLVANGISPGAAIAFLMTGPASNATTLGLVRQLHGRKVALLFSSLMVLIPMFLGIIINHFYTDFKPIQIDMQPSKYSYFHWFALILLILGLIESFYRQGAKAFIAEIIHPLDNHAHNHEHRSLDNQSQYNNLNHEHA